MRRSDRLFDLILLLRDGRLHRAADLAQTLEVSTRTIYRDMDTLVTSGVPVQGERGIGYMITAAITLPPINLTEVELEALHLGMSIVQEAADDQLQRAAASLSAKIDAVLPEGRVAPPSGWGFAVYPFSEAAKGFKNMPPIRAAIRAHQKLHITYRDQNNIISTRTLRPLQMEYWGRVWTLTAWCEARDNFRVFRVDRIQNIALLDDIFADEDGKALADYLHQIGEG